MSIRRIQSDQMPLASLVLFGRFPDIQSIIL